MSDLKREILSGNQSLAEESLMLLEVKRAL